MNNMAMGMLMAVGAVTAATTDLPERLAGAFEEIMETTRQVCTAGDLHSISVMLDAKYVLDRKLPAEEEFGSWMQETFKENNVKDLAADHWGSRYIYKLSADGRSYRLISAGNDGRFGTDDDMTKSGP